MKHKRGNRYRYALDRNIYLLARVAQAARKSMGWQYSLIRMDNGNCFDGAKMYCRERAGCISAADFKRLSGDTPEHFEYVGRADK